MKNYLLDSLNDYFKEVLAIEGKLTVSESFLNAHKNTIIGENREYRDIVGQITNYRDLAQIKGGDNLYTPNYDYQMTVDNMENEISDIISQQSCFAVAQVYEVFESYLIEVLTAFLQNNQTSLITIKFKDSNIILLEETIKEKVKKAQGRNNKGLLSIVRKITSHFKTYESNNIHNVNISEWFDLVTMIRHTLVHNRQVVSSRLLKYLKTHNANEMFNRHFKRKSVGNKICIYLEKNTASDIINWLNTFAHFIFTALSIEAGLSLKIPFYTPRPPTRF